MISFDLKIFTVTGQSLDKLEPSPIIDTTIGNGNWSKFIERLACSIFKWSVDIALSRRF